jgi:hypothetical protein
MMGVACALLQQLQASGPQHDHHPDINGRKPH